MAGIKEKEREGGSKFGREMRGKNTIGKVKQRDVRGQEGEVKGKTGSKGTARHSKG